ncbi:MAG: dephospho-CoA kinase [Lewinellaceae bacterium]|nr:dephospho-CoA kinase [Saprospiraceae bacterium]MCB9330318.1 dephospho-CoA kinase [Lewinellaceae bacterium]
MPEQKNTKSCLRVGITGGIGSGKTTVCRIFAALGVPVYDADYWAKWLIMNDPAVKAAIEILIGPDAYLPDGTYNRALVASVVFQEKAKLAALNGIVHPAVERHSSAWHAQKAALGVAYTLKEAALMVESGSHRHLDYLIVVTAPEALRIHRVMERDNLPEEAVRQRLQNQLPESEKVALADFLINNDGTQLLIPQVWAVHRTLTDRARLEI